jgi:hypothetical protein
MDESTCGSTPVAEVRAKARRLNLIEVPCTRCRGTGLTKDRSITEPDGWLRRPCACEGRGFWFARPGSSMWMRPEDVVAQVE